MHKEQIHITSLIQACKKGNQPAQFEIYKLYYKAMYNTSLRIVKDSFEAEDIMQEAFLSAFTKLDTYRGEVAFGAWLKRIVINNSLTHLKVNNRFTEVKLEVVERNLSTDEEEYSSKEAMDYSVIRAKEIVDVIGKLKDNYRMALTLNLIEGYDNEEIASIMNISNENCRTTISRAKSKLRKLFSEMTVIN